jgi:hypothetical protein
MARTATFILDAHALTSILARYARGYVSVRYHYA